MTIYKIKELTQKTSPYFFSPYTLNFFGQTMKSFKVSKQNDGRYLIYAIMKDSNKKIVGETIRYFNPENNELENE